MVVDELGVEDEMLTVTDEQASFFWHSDEQVVGTETGRLVALMLALIGPPSSIAGSWSTVESSETAEAGAVEPPTGRS